MRPRRENWGFPGMPPIEVVRLSPVQGPNTPDAIYIKDNTEFEPGTAFTGLSGFERRVDYSARELVKRLQRQARISAQRFEAERLDRTLLTLS
jgi:hypothetical protein